MQKNMQDAAAIVLAAGQGSRMQSTKAKQFMDLQGKPLLYYSLKAFADSGIGNIVIVTGQEFIEYCQKEIVDRYHISHVSAIVAGGKERYHSVYEGLKAVGAASLVMIHDGARPFVTQAMIESSYDMAKDKGAAIVGVPVKDTIKQVSMEHIAIDTPDRSTLWQIQTPQSFEYQLIRCAYDRMLEQEDEAITDDAMVLERYGNHKATVIMGSYQNIKITTPDDMIVANAYLEQRKKNKKNIVKNA